MNGGWAFFFSVFILGTSLIGCGGEGLARGDLARAWESSPVSAAENDDDVPPHIRGLPLAGRQLDGCKMGGCGPRICTEEDQDVATTCDYRPEYDCQARMDCLRSAVGTCHLRPTTASQTCMSRLPKPPPEPVPDITEEASP